MPISQIHSFLVHPAKNDENRPVVYGTRLPQHGKLFLMLTALYNNASKECDVEIIFRPSTGSLKDNQSRSLLVKYVDAHTLQNGRAIAERLQAVTTHRSGMGLLFLVAGQEGHEHRLLLARFPADQGVIAQEGKTTLNLEFIERVFMKSAKAYKSALYSGRSFAADFWDGKAVDKQINEVRELSNYWIGEFLDSELRTTGPAGTKRLAIAIRETIRLTRDQQIRDSLLSAAYLLPGHHGRRSSSSELFQTIGLSEPTQDAVKAAFPRPELFQETFQFDQEEFARHIFYRSIELDNGAFLIGENTKFDSIFRKEQLRTGGNIVRYSTEGKVVNEHLRKAI